MFPYGFGLSYTTFRLDNAGFSADDEKVTAKCTVTNTGGRDGAEVVRCTSALRIPVDRPVKLLRGFKRVELKAGESKEVSISCPLEKLCWYNPETNSWELEKWIMKYTSAPAAIMMIYCRVKLPLLSTKRGD